MTKLPRFFSKFFSILYLSHPTMSASIQICNMQLELSNRHIFMIPKNRPDFSMFLGQFHFNNVHFYTQRSIFFYSQHFLHFYSLLHLHLWVDCQNILLQIFSNNRCAIIQIHFVLCFKLSQRSLCVSLTNSNTSGSITIISTGSKLISS